MNEIYIGFKKDIELPKAGLFIGDEVIAIPRARIFDPLKHSFNSLKDIDYKKARELANVLHTISPEVRARSLSGSAYLRVAFSTKLPSAGSSRRQERRLCSRGHRPRLQVFPS
jgi:hypothetical protein